MCVYNIRDGLMNVLVDQKGKVREERSKAFSGVIAELSSVRNATVSDS